MSGVGTDIRHGESVYQIRLRSPGKKNLIFEFLEKRKGDVR